MHAALPAGPRSAGQRLLCVALVGTALLLQAAYFANMVSWRYHPDRGWILWVPLGPNVVAETRPVGEAAGLRKGDEILSLNGQSYETLDELRVLVRSDLGVDNVYEVRRGEATLTVRIPNRPQGLERVLRQSGIYWLLGMLFVGGGLLVFTMKPWQPASWAFLGLTSALGVATSYFSASGIFRPALLGSAGVLLTPLMAATVLHLAALFPQRRAFTIRRPWLLALPYVLALGLVGAALTRGLRLDQIPGALRASLYLYLAAAVLLFLGSTAVSWWRSRSVAVRLQSLVIFTGIFAAFLIPSIELVSNVLFGVSFFPSLVVAYLACLAVFPLSIGYAIARHDLFEIDVIVRRTYGYLLSSAVVVLLYGATVSALNLALGPSEIARSPFFTIAFVLGVVFLMQPLQGRIQGLVDRAFYRQQYDYRTTLSAVTDRITSLLEPALVGQTLVGAAVEEMFLENGVLLSTEDGGRSFEPELTRGIDWPPYRPRRLILAAPLGDALVREQVPVFRHEIELAPRYREHRAELRESFDQLEAELMLPMVYQERLRGVLSLGRKKSGKMFTREDVDLLRTLLASSAVALENARLFDEVADSLKQIQLLETVKANLAKFVPQTVQSLVEESDDADALFQKRDRDLSVMFADMTGYTRLSAQLPQEEVNAIIERYFGAFLDEILQQGGDVNETAGDGLMVLFQDDDARGHAEAAVRAALGIQRLTREINAERADSEPIGMHIGVNSGVASVGATKIQGGAGMRWTYTASGPVTNIAARIGALGEEIAITGETRSRLGADFVVKERGPQSLKNVKDLIMVYCVEGGPGAAPASAEPEPAAAPRETGRGRFVVHGTVRRDGTGRALPGLRVKAYDRDLMRDDFLGEATTDAAGRYEIRFTDEFFADLFEQSPDLYVRVFDPTGERELCSTRDSVRWNAGAEERLDVEVPAATLPAGIANDPA